MSRNTHNRTYDHHGTDLDTSTMITAGLTTSASGTTLHAALGNIEAALPLGIMTTKGDLLVRSATAPARLAAGTNGKYLMADSAATNGVTWATASGVTDHGALSGLADDDHTQYTRKDTLTTKGDLYARDGSAVVRVGVGTNGKYLMADSAATAGVTWTTVSGGGLTVEEIDEVPTVNEVTVIRFPNGWVTNDGGGQVTVAAVASGVGDGVAVKEVDGDPDVIATTIRFPNGSVTDDGGNQVTIAFPGLAVQEIDGSPSLTGITTIKVPAGWLTDNGGGTATISGSSGSSVPDGTNIGDLLVWDGSGWDVLAASSGGAPLVADETSPLGVAWGTGADISVVGANWAYGASPNTINKPSGTQDGDLLIWACQTTNSVPNVSGPDGSGWTQALSFDTSSTEYQVVWYKVASSEASSWSLTHSVGVDVVSALAVFRGVDTLFNSAFVSDSFTSPPILGHQKGLQVIVYLTTTGGATPITAPAFLSTAINANNPSSTNRPSALIGFRRSSTTGAVPSFVASGPGPTYQGTLVLVFTA